MGTLIVHRLINDRDREVVERAAGELDRSAAEFLPTLGPGKAAIIGVDRPMPLTIQMQKPSKKHEPWLFRPELSGLLETNNPKSVKSRSNLPATQLQRLLTRIVAIVQRRLFGDSQRSVVG